ncbi:MAG: hypothetical protein DPW15_14975, partial [Chloroflexi bacterium]|nr:hypothetical protein [Chloroflexota bacterium]
WSLKNRQAETAMRLAGALSEFWKMRGYEWEGMRWLELTLDLARPRVHLLPAQVQSKVHLGMGMLAFETAPTAKIREITQAHTEKAIRLYKKTGDCVAMVRAIYINGGAAWLAGDFSAARVIFENGYEIAARENDSWGMGSCQHYLGHLAKNAGNFKNARAHFEESAVLLRQSGDLWNYAHPVIDIANCCWDEGEIQKAWERHQESLDIFRAVGDMDNAAWQQRQLGIRALWMGKYDLAQDLLERALAFAFDYGDKINNALSPGYLGLVALFQCRFSAAQERLELALRLNREIGSKNNIAWALGAFGLLHYYNASPNEARAALDESLTIFEQIPNAEKSDHALACLTRGDLARLDGDLDSARGFYLKSLTLTEALPLLPYPVEGFAKLNILHAQAERAARLFGAANKMREQMEIPIPPVECNDYEKHL